MRTSSCVRCCSLPKLTIQTVTQISLSNTWFSVIFTLHTPGLTRFDGTTPLVIVGNMWISRELCHPVSSSHTHTHLGVSQLGGTAPQGLFDLEIAPRISLTMLPQGLGVATPQACQPRIHCVLVTLLPTTYPISEILLPESYLSGRNQKFMRSIETKLLCYQISWVKPFVRNNISIKSHDLRVKMHNMIFH